jgi:peptidoglycan/LPS O-acetylase OafA/YrhL
LAIEEQFYLAWPLAVFLLPKRSIKYAALGTIVASPIIRLWCAHELPGLDLYYNTFTRLDGLAFGALLAALSLEWSARSIQKLSWLLLAAGAVIIPASVFLRSESILYSGIAMAFCSAVAYAILSPAFLRNRFLEYTGAISYGMYLFHFFFFDIISRLGVVPHGFWRALATYLLTAFPLTYVSANIHGCDHLLELA